MSVAIRPVNGAKDREELLDLLARNLGASQEQRFEWRHHANPAGAAWSWFIYDCTTKRTVGMASVFPRNVCVEGKTMVCGQVGDFVIDATHRSLGPAVMLQKATFEPVKSGAISFCYDCPPHDAGMSTFVRLGMRPNCSVTRYALPLRSDEFLTKKLGKRLWTKPAVATANLLLKARMRRGAGLNLEISSSDAPFGDEFSELDNAVSSSGVVRASRSAKDLNWRYREDPLRAQYPPNGNVGEYRMLVARRKGRLIAFVVFFLQSDGIASIVDLFGCELPIAGPALLEAVIDVCRPRNIAGAHGFCSDDSPLNVIFRKVGFHPRERAARVVAFALPEHQISKVLNNGTRWALSQVEIMV